MGNLKSQIDGNTAQRSIASAVNKPWYYKVEVWLMIANLIAILVNIFLTLK